jgi:hypothetical protein
MRHIINVNDNGKLTQEFRREHDMEALTVAKIRAALSEMPDHLEVGNEFATMVIAVEEASYNDAAGEHPYIRLEFEDDGAISDNPRDTHASEPIVA